MAGPHRHAPVSDPIRRIRLDAPDPLLRVVAPEVTFHGVVDGELPLFGVTVDGLSAEIGGGERGHVR